MPKKSKGKKSHSRGKGKKKSKKGKTSKKKENKVTSVLPEPKEPDVFIWVRRKNTSLYVEATEDLTIKELKLMVATTYGYFPEDISLFNNLDEMIEKKDLKKEEDKGKGQAGSKSSGKSGSGSSRGSSKDKRDSKSKRRGSKGKHSDPVKEREKESQTVQIFNLGNYGFNARSSPLFNPGTIGLVFRDKNGNFEPLEILPWTNPAEIPESVKPYLRNYNPEDLTAGDELEVDGMKSTKNIKSMKSIKKKA